MNWPRSMTCALLAVAAACAAFAQQSPLNEGLRLLREGRYEEACAQLEQAHRAAPANALVDNLLGLAETQLGRRAEANVHFRAAIARAPAQPGPHRNLGFNLLTDHDYAAAEPELRAAARLDPGDPFAHYYLTLLALARQRDAEAIAESARAGTLIDNDAETAAGLAEAEIRQGRGEAALKRVEALERAAHLAPGRAYQLAALFSRNGMNTEALACFRWLAQQDPTWENRYNLALALLYAGQPAEASTLLETLHEERPSSADALTFLGASLEAQQNSAAALEAYRKAVAADPANPNRMLDYTRLLMDSDRYDEAVQSLESGLQSGSAAAPLEVRLGAVEMVKGDYSAARAAFTRALAADPALDVACVGLAQTHAREGHDEEALRILNDARRQRPQSYLLAFYSGMLASRLDRRQEAVDALEAAARLDPSTPAPFYELGKLYVAAQDWPHARAALEHGIALKPDFAPAHYQLSRVYSRLGLAEKAAAEGRVTQSLMESQRTAAMQRQRAEAGGFHPAP